MLKTKQAKTAKKILKKGRACFRQGEVRLPPPDLHLHRCADACFSLSPGKEPAGGQAARAALRWLVASRTLSLRPALPLCGFFPRFAQWPTMAARVPVITSTFQTARRKEEAFVPSVTGTVLGSAILHFYSPLAGQRPHLSAVKPGNAGSQGLLAPGKSGYEGERKVTGVGVGHCSLCQSKKWGPAPPGIKKCYSPSWCVSADWVLSCELKGHRFNSQSSTCLGCRSGPQ